MLPIVLLAGGLATRLRPVTESIPKAMIDVNGAPFIAHLLKRLHERGIRRAVICAGYRGEMIRDYVGDGSRFGMDVQVVFDGKQLLGTGGAVKNVLPLLGDAFFVQYGDSYLMCDYRAVAERFRRSGRSALMTVYRNDGQWDASNVELADGRIVRYQKGLRDPRMRRIDYGLGAFRTDAFQGVPDQQPYDLADLYGELLRRGELEGMEIGERFYEAGSFTGLEEMRKLLADEAEKAVGENVHRRNDPPTEKTLHPHVSTSWDRIKRSS